MSERGYQYDARGEHFFATPSFVVPGLGESGEPIAPFSQSLAAHGHKVFTVEMPRPRRRAEVVQELEAAKKEARRWYKTNRPDVEEERLEALLASVPLTLFEKAQAVIRVMEQGTVKGECVRAIAHSQGAGATAVAAVLRPDLFPKTDSQSAMILINPSGLTGQEGIQPSKELAASGKVLQSRVAKLKEFFGNRWREAAIMAGYTVAALRTLFSGSSEERARTRKAVAGGYWHILKNLFTFRIQDEAHDMANTDMVPFLQLAHENGVRIVVIYDTKDPLFPKGAIEKRKEDAAFIEFHETEGGGHFAPIKKPEETVQTINTILKIG